MDSTLSSGDQNQQIFAYHKVKFYKKDLQGKCDSFVYTMQDSLMKLMNMPTLWSEENQLTADTIFVNTGKNTIKSIELKGDPFIVSQEDSIHYNQIRGKYMQGYFLNNELHIINIEGNGQTIYYAKEDSSGELKAVNRADCSDLRIYLKDNKIDRINFITQPEANLYPLDRIDNNDLKLKGFSWRDIDRPKNVADIFNW